MTTTKRPRPDLAPTSPHSGGRPHESDLAPRPLPFGGEVTLTEPDGEHHPETSARPRGDLTGDHTCDYCDAWPTIPCALHDGRFPGHSVNAGARR